MRGWICLSLLICFLSQAQCYTGAPYYVTFANENGGSWTTFTGAEYIDVNGVGKNSFRQSDKKHKTNTKKIITINKQQHQQQQPQQKQQQQTTTTSNPNINRMVSLILCTHMLITRVLPLLLVTKCILGMEKIGS